jgi:peptide/nickel transport system substrate-binding protein
MQMRRTLRFTLDLFTIALAAAWLPSSAGAAPEGQIIIAQGADPTTLDPHMHAENFTFAVVHNVFDHLVRRTVKDGQLAHEPGLASSWTSVNPTTWEFKLRRGVKFHNGEELNAEAVKFSVERVLNPDQKARWRWAFADIERVEVVDPLTLRIVTKRPFPTLITNLAYTMPIVPPKYVREKGDAYVATHPVGSGPFKFVRWRKDDELVLEANETYWGGSPKVRTLIFKPIPEESTRVAALIGGQVDVARGVPPSLVKQVEDARGQGALRPQYPPRPRHARRGAPARRAGPSGHQLRRRQGRHHQVRPRGQWVRARRPIDAGDVRLRRPGQALPL